MFNYHKKITIGDLEREFSLISKHIEELHLPRGFLDFLLYALSELFANIKEHSGTKTVFIAIESGPQNCFVRISDKGMGFRKSYLRKQIYPKDDFAAIEFALSGLSTKDSKTRGFGLYSIRKLVEGLDGKMIVESGFAKALISKNQMNFKKFVKQIRGVSVTVNVPMQAINFYQFVE